MRLIDANALHADLRESYEELIKIRNGLIDDRDILVCNGEISSFLETMLRVKGSPTVDAVPVVHGRWLDVQETDMYVPDMKFTTTRTEETCSECKSRIGFVGAKLYLFDSVCPHCGAKMDGGVDDG